MGHGKKLSILLNRYGIINNMKKTLAESRRDDLVQSIMLHQEDWADSVGVNYIGYTTAELVDLTDAELETIAADYDKNPPGAWRDDNTDVEMPDFNTAEISDEDLVPDEGERLSKFSGMGRRTESLRDKFSKLSEAEYKGRDVTLGKPMKGDVKKFKVYVKDKKTGNVKKVNFGDPNAEIKRDDPARRKSFRARHGCGTPRASDRTKAAFWSCRMWGKKPVSDILKKESVAINLLRKIIREEFEGTTSQVRQRIATMDPNESSDQDYYDIDTGEVYLHRGERAGSSKLHPNYSKPAKPKFSVADEEDVPETEQAPSSEDAWTKAAQAYAESWADYDTTDSDDEAQGVAMDAALSFFPLHPEWKKWASDLGMTQAEMQTAMAEFIYEAMVSGNIPTTVVSQYN